MRSGSLVPQRARYYSSVTLIYLLTLLFALFMFWPQLLRGRPAAAANLPAAAVYLPKQLTAAAPVIISGTPVRIVIPSLSIDLAIQPGYYNAADNSWTLSDTLAQFATVTAPANNYSGNTFIYGHRMQNIFGDLFLVKPGDEVLIYTSNNHIFAYLYTGSQKVLPQDTSVLNYQGAPILTVQTCGGAWNEQRQMFVFKFERVIK